MTIINMNAIEMTTTDSKTICLPYNGLTDEMSLEVITAVADHYKDTSADVISLISDIKAYVILRPSRLNPQIGYKLDITTTDGQTITKRIRVNASPNEIMERFFKTGAAGLKEDYRQCYERQHKAYCGRYAA